MPTLTIAPEKVTEVHTYGLISTEGAGSVMRRNKFPAGRKKQTQYKLEWTLANEAEVDALLSLFRQVKGAGTITWSPPGESAGTFSILNNDVQVTYRSGSTASVELTLLEV